MRVIFTGGGTGGHIYPALAVARELEALSPGVRILYVGTGRGLEAELVPRMGLDFVAIRARGLLGKRALERAWGVALLGVSAAQSARIIRRFRPRAVFGTGGYVAGPVVLAALALRVPVALQEQNVVPGFTNRWLSRYVDKVFVPFDECNRFFPARARLRVTGNPIRREVLEADPDESRRELGLAPSERLVLLLGGSRGARSINEAGIGLARQIGECPGTKLAFVTGTAYYDWVLRGLDGLGIRPESDGKIILRPYEHRIERLLAAAHIVVARAGAMTVAEITARGIPAILVPSPNVVNDHQQHNARVLEKGGAAFVIQDDRLEAGILYKHVKRLLEDQELHGRMAQNSKSLGKPAAARQIASEILDMLA